MHLIRLWIISSLVGHNLSFDNSAADIFHAFYEKKSEKKIV